MGVGKALGLSGLALVGYLALKNPARTIGYNLGLGDIANRTDISERIRNNVEYKSRTGLATAENSYDELKNDATNLYKKTEKRVKEGLRTHFTK